MEHAGIRRVSFEGNEGIALGYAKQALQELERLQSYMKAGGISVARKFVPLSDSAYLIVGVAGNLNACHIVASPGVRKLPRLVVDVERQPDFLSGWVQTGIIEEDDPPPLPPNQPKIKVLNGMFPTQQTADLQNAFKAVTGAQELSANTKNRVQRLAIEPWSQMSELRAKPPSTRIYSQYTILKPTMYSGLMRACVQGLMGFGKQNKRSIYSTIEAAHYEEDEDPPVVGSAHIDTGYEERVKTDGLVIEYDFRWFRTHGICKAADDSMWLIEISGQRGVLAMPLPLHRVTRTDRFKEKLQNLAKPGGNGNIEDKEGLGLLEKFSGFPTGESFPVGSPDDPPHQSPLKAAINAGRVKQLCTKEDVAPFYEKFSAYSTAMGWAFSESGKLADNTGYRYGDNGLQRGAHFSVSINIGAGPEIDFNDKGALKLIERVLNILKPGAASYFYEINGGGTPEPEVAERQRAIKDSVYYVVENMLTKEQLQNVLGEAGNYGAKGLFEQFINDAQAVVGGPVGPGGASANFKKAAEGNLYMPGKFWSVDQIKFGDPLFECLVSHDGRPLDNGVDHSESKSDTIMHVFYVGEKLKYVKFYRQPDKDLGEQVEDDTPDDCTVLVGKYTRKETRGVTRLSGFYTDDLDEREETTEEEEITVREGKDMGYVSAGYAFHSFFSIGGDMGRVKAFRRSTLETVKTGMFRSTTVSIPQFEREAYYYVFYDLTERKTESFSGESDGGIRDPNRYTILSLIHI